jgi:hypothetical protein
MSLLVVCQGIQGALLHGNGDVGERSVGGPQRRNGAVAVGSVQRNGGSRTSKYLKAARTQRRTRRLTLRLCSKVLSRKGDCGSGNDGERWTAEDVQCSWLQMPLQPWMGVAGWESNSNVTRLER